MTTALPEPATGTPSHLLEPGRRLRWRGHLYVIAAQRSPAVHLVSLTGEEPDVYALASVVLEADGFGLPEENGRPRPAPEGERAGLLRWLGEDDLRHVQEWERHLTEIRDGQIPATPAQPGPDHALATSTLKQRFAAKAAELQAAGWRHCSAGTIERRYRAWHRHGLAGLIRRTVPHPWGRTDERVIRLLHTHIETGGTHNTTSHSGSHLLEQLRAAIRLNYPAEYDRLNISPATFYRLLHRLRSPTGHPPSR
ncbi:hypothetical protein [Streptomyces sp. CB01580]|uniref:hypothetical protein n=1 Tax=Streptomyces sp. CB01580 TaxID=1703933 RepID=UPI00093DB6AA|nr:hypothetical protein [Streptomyces sp. CB01580]OKJ27845.1 hypothetical protein AMK22_30055 [Streptomyces sp. CB01580]